MPYISSVDVSKKIERLVKSPVQALLILGQNSEDNLALGRLIARKILALDKLDNYPYLMELLIGDKKSIGIDDIRRINKFLSLKIASSSDVSRVVIIEKAGAMGVESQNALLKILEEPPANTVLILESSNESLLLPTVMSRMTKIHNTPPSRPKLRDQFSQYSETDFNRAYSISQNNPGLLEQLLEDKDHPLALAAVKAREVLTSDVYGRLVKVDELAKEPQIVRDMLYILERMATISLESSEKDQMKWSKVLDGCYAAGQAINQKAQLKLVLINLFINL